MNISIKYSYITKTLLMAFLYIPIFPLGIIISFFGFCLAFLLEKFNFCKIYKKPEMLGAKICQFYIDYFVIILFVYGLGDYFFLQETYKNNIWSLINLITFGILIFIPYIKILDRDYLNIDTYNFHKKEYKDCFEFTQDYERANPISKKEGKINYLKKLKEKGIITENEFNDYIKDIYNINIMQIYYKNKNNNNNNNNDDVDKKIEIDNNFSNNNNGSFSANINININNGKKKKKTRISKQLTLNQVNQVNPINSFNSNSNSNNIYHNNIEDSSNQNYLGI